MDAKKRIVLSSLIVVSNALVIAGPADACAGCGGQTYSFCVNNDNEMCGSLSEGATLLYIHRCEDHVPGNCCLYLPQPFQCYSAPPANDCGDGYEFKIRCNYVGQPCP
jgi:hypothetical protein